MTYSGQRRLRQGLFIVFEGLDGAGKTTQIRLLERELQQQGCEVLCLREPTDGPWGQKIREAVRQGKHEMTPAQEFAWFLADRHEDVEQNIQPALARGQIVLLDRYYFSTMAYQGALGCDPDVIRQRHEAFAPLPHLLFLLDITPSQGLQRVQQERQLDGFERLDYLERVAAIFAAMDFPYLRRIPATLTPEAVQAQIRRDVVETLARWPQMLDEDEES